MAPADREGWACGAPMTALEHSVAATKSVQVRDRRPGRQGMKRFLAPITVESLSCSLLVFAESMWRI